MLYGINIWLNDVYALDYIIGLCLHKVNKYFFLKQGDKEFYLLSNINKSDT